MHGITRDSIKTLAPKLGFGFSEKKISINEVIEKIKSEEITEIFGMGTGAVVAPIGKLFYKDQEIEINNGKSGKVAKAIYNSLTAIQYGIEQDPLIGYIQYSINKNESKNMATVKLIQYEESNSEVREIYDDIRKTRGGEFIINFWLCFGE